MSSDSRPNDSYELAYLMNRSKMHYTSYCFESNSPPFNPSQGSHTFMRNTSKTAVQTVLCFSRQVEGSVEIMFRGVAQLTQFLESRSPAEFCSNPTPTHIQCVAPTLSTDGYIQ